MTVEQNEPSTEIDNVIEMTRELTDSEKLDEILATQRKILEFVGAIKEEVGPAIEAISASPVGRMLGMGKG